jgi:hypothetical protein
MKPDIILSSRQYQRLKSWDREVLGISDFTAEDIAAIERVSARGDHI